SEKPIFAERYDVDRDPERNELLATRAGNEGRLEHDTGRNPRGSRRQWDEAQTRVDYLVSVPGPDWCRCNVHSGAVRDRCRSGGSTLRADRTAEDICRTTHRDRRFELASSRSRAVRRARCYPTCQHSWIWLRRGIGCM